MVDQISETPFLKNLVYPPSTSVQELRPEDKGCSGCRDRNPRRSLHVNFVCRDRVTDPRGRGRRW